MTDLNAMQQANIARSACLASRCLSHNDVAGTDTHIDEIISVNGGIELAVILWCQAVARHVRANPDNAVDPLLAPLGSLIHPSATKQDHDDADALKAMITAVGNGDVEGARLVWHQPDQSDDEDQAVHDKSRIASHALAAAARVARGGA